LRISWVEGARWFSDTLLDADAAINGMMWQVKLCYRRAS
jgi:deoxyribodipyrimidine photolyase